MTAPLTFGERLTLLEALKEMQNGEILLCVDIEQRVYFKKIKDFKLLYRERNSYYQKWEEVEDSYSDLISHKWYKTKEKPLTPKEGIEEVIKLIGCAEGNIKATEGLLVGYGAVAKAQLTQAREILEEISSQDEEE